jgi:cation/acetate symporter
MAAGFIAGSAYLYYVYTGGEPWYGIDGLRFGIIGMPVSLVSMVAVSLMTPAPDAEIQAMVDETRIPTGDTILAENH